jgi:hypothetical protein
MDKLVNTVSETIAVYCENHTEHINTLCGKNAVCINLVRTSQETHNVSATKPNRLMLFREIIAVYCENHMEYTTTPCRQIAVYANAVRTSQKINHVSATGTNQLCCLGK